MHFLPILAIFSIIKCYEAQITHKIGDLTGPGITTIFKMDATDLGIPIRTPDGRILFVFGDTFQNAHVGDGWWRSPVGLWSETKDLNSGVKWSGAVGGDAAQQFWDYEHNNPQFSTVLPSDLIVIDDVIYLHAMVNQGLGNVQWTEIWRSDNNGANWTHTGAKFPSDIHGGMFQLFTWGLGDDGIVYVFSTGFQRDKPIILHRVPKDKITDLTSYDPWGYANGAWAWGNPPTPIMDGQFGEMCLRPLGGKWVFTFFDAGDYRIDGMVFDTPTSNLHTAYRKTLVWGGSWGAENDNHVAQLYGGYIIPGSTLNTLHLSVSQWNTDAGWPYHVQQFRVTGFFGQSCPDGWFQSGFSKGCFNLFTSAKSWSDARADCQKTQGADLVSIDNAFANTELDEYITDNASSCTQVFIGLTNTGGTWSWINGDGSGYRNWANGNPTNDASKKCGVMNPKNGLWTNEDCALSHCYVCRKNLS